MRRAGRKPAEAGKCRLAARGRLYLASILCSPAKRRPQWGKPAHEPQSTRARARALSALRSAVAFARLVMAAAPTEPVISDYVRVRRKKTTIFLWADPADTAVDLKAKIHKITKVPAVDMKLFIDKNGEVVLDDNKSLADQKARALPARPRPARPPNGLHAGTRDVQTLLPTGGQ